MSDSFAELLRRYRVAASLTQEGLAERANIGTRRRLPPSNRGCAASPGYPP